MKKLLLITLFITASIGVAGCGKNQQDEKIALEGENITSIAEDSKMNNIDDKEVTSTEEQTTDASTEEQVSEASEPVASTEEQTTTASTEEQASENSETTDLTKEQALEAIKNYCYSNNEDLKNMEDSEEYTISWEVSENGNNEIVVLYRSYTGAETRYYINPSSGDAYATEFVPGITEEEEKTGETLNVRDYLN